MLKTDNLPPLPGRPEPLKHVLEQLIPAMANIFTGPEFPVKILIANVRYKANQAGFHAQCPKQACRRRKSCCAVEENNPPCAKFRDDDHRAALHDMRYGVFAYWAQLTADAEREQDMFLGGFQKKAPEANQ